jgi:hypothetical protein
MRGTDATGSGRWGRAVLAIEAVLLALATVWSIPHVVSPNMTDRGVMVALDAAWPLSMAWLIPLGVTVARARRWPSPARFAPLVASLWLVADIAAMAVGDTAFTIVHITWLIGAYGWVGLALIRDVADTAGKPLSTAAEPTTAT